MIFEAAGDGTDIVYQEGTRIRLPNGQDYGTEKLFCLTAAGSMALGGKPVVCIGIVPGFTLRATISLPTRREEAWQVAQDMWESLAPKLSNLLLVSRPHALARFRSAEDGILFELVYQEPDPLPANMITGAMHFEVEYDADLAKRYARDRLRQPLLDSKPDGENLSAEQARVMRGLFRDAFAKSRFASDNQYARLPVPVRYRATGALIAWAAFRQMADRYGAGYGRLLVQMPVPGFVQVLEPLVQQATHRTLSHLAAPHVPDYVTHSAVWQAFDARQGALYEPTPAMHRLLDAAYIADDVPVGMIDMPADTLCLIPDPSWWDKGIEAIALFRHRLDYDGQMRESISIVTASRARGRATTNMLEVRLDAPDKTIREDLEEALAGSAVSRGTSEEAAQAREHWRAAFDYAIKMLLYLKVRDAQVVHDLAWSNAPRDFSGLGQRKRVERLAQLELLYDRHIVGPAVLDIESVQSIPADGERHEVRGHWRRPHFRMQPHGPQSSLRKLVFIGPTVVRPDRLDLSSVTRSS